MGKLDDITFELEVLHQQLEILKKRIEKRRQIAEKSIFKKIFHFGSAPYRLVKKAFENGSILGIIGSLLLAIVATVTLICPILAFAEKIWDMSQDDKRIILENQKIATEVRINELNEMKEQIVSTDSTYVNQEELRKRAVQKTFQEPERIADEGAELIRKTK